MSRLRQSRIHEWDGKVSSIYLAPADKIDQFPHRRAIIHALKSSVFMHFMWKVAFSVSICMSLDLLAEERAACDIDNSSLMGFPGPKE